jgi:imidazolonepropionase-like amidohydrolase
VRRGERAGPIRIARLCLSAFATFLVCATHAEAQSPKLAVYRGAALIDGTGATLKSDVAIVVDGERIHAIVPDAQATAYLRGATVIDAHGLYALPGLIDSHVHLATSPNRRYAEAILRRDVYSGVTAVRDMAGDARLLADLSRGALLGEIAAPDIYYAALMAGPEFFKDLRTADAARGAVPGEVPWMRAITTSTDLRLAVAEARGTGATAIKIYADLPGSLMKNIVDEAHRQNLLVWAHAAVFPASPREVIDSGVDVVSHVCMLAYQVSEQMPHAYHGRAPVEEAKFAGGNPQMDALFSNMKRRGTILDATLYVYDVMWRERNAQARPYCTLRLAEKLAAEAHRAGITISSGTDDPGDWNDPYPSLYGELSLFVHAAGFSPMDAIVSATRIGAMTIGKAREMGTVEPGKLANFVFVSGNPLDDIANLKSVTMTVKRGRLYRRTAYRPITKDEAQGEF